MNLATDAIEAINVETSAATTDTCRGWTASREQVRLVGLVLAVAAGALLVLSGALLVRRLAGAFGQRPAPEVLIIVAVTLTAVVAGIRGAWRRVFRSNATSERNRALLLDGTLSVGACCLAASISIPDAGTGPLVILWGFLVTGELVGWSPYYRRLGRRIRANGDSEGAQREASPTTNAEPTSELSAAAIHEVATLEEPAGDDELLSPNVSQRIVRARDENGVETVYGVVRCDFTAGQRQQNLHIAFCPPLEFIPELTTDQLDGPMVKIKPSMVEVFGAGLEIKLPAPCSEPTSVQIQFYAFEKPDDVAPSN